MLFNPIFCWVCPISCGLDQMGKAHYLKKKNISYKGVSSNIRKKTGRVLEKKKKIKVRVLNLLQDGRLNIVRFGYSLTC